MDERGNKPTDPEWVKTLRPGWQAYRNHNFCSILAGIPIEEDLVGDKWTSLFKNLAKLLSGKNNSDLSGEDMALMSEIADYQKMNEIRNRVSSTVRIRRRPRRSSRGTVNGASARPSTTSICPPSTGPTSSWWTPRARASTA